MANNFLKNIQAVTYSLKILTTRFYSKPAHVTRINLNRNTNLDGDSLQVRFLKYIGISNVKDYNTEKAKIRYSDFFPITDPKILKQHISEVEINEFPTLLNYLYTYNTRVPPNNVLSCINLIEREICSKIDMMTPKEMFNILYAYMFVIPGFTSQLKFYEQSVMKLSNTIDDLSKEHLIQYTFYLGLSKQNNPELTNVLKNILLIISDKHLNDLTIEELCIITNAAFKMSVKINTIDLLNHISKTLIEGLKQKKLDIPSIITLLKSLRISRYFSSELFKALSEFIDNEASNLRVTAISHILPYYADNYYMDEHIINILTTRFLQDLTNESSEMRLFETNNVRGKDLARFLWALSYLGWSVDHKTHEELENIVLNKFNAGDYKNNTDDLFNLALSFCTLNYIPKRLLRLITESKIIKMKPNTARAEERRALLCSILNIEHKNLFEEAPELVSYWNFIKNKHTEPLTTGRENLQKVLHVALTPDVGLTDLKLGCQIDFLNTPGITATTASGKKIFIEVLDDSICLKNTQSEPNGIMKLKLRLLDQISNNSTILIKQSDVEGKDEEYIRKYLTNEISKFV